eukprot:TRINITY_DN208_c0_g4_i1.p1 TRINITY_DN208_c0_g4~~TRINITY_DN208_c0_g4_i1.p1  ORF type:complete len:183 (+),score=44.79 TRINITY_DN208_c0_g4_i1:362-910(+)
MLVRCSICFFVKFSWSDRINWIIEFNSIVKKTQTSKAVMLKRALFNSVKNTNKNLFIKNCLPSGKLLENNLNLSDKNQQYNYAKGYDFDGPNDEISVELPIHYAPNYEYKYDGKIPENDELDPNMWGPDEDPHSESHIALISLGTALGLMGLFYYGIKLYNPINPVGPREFDEKTYRASYQH